MRVVGLCTCLNLLCSPVQHPRGSMPDRGLRNKMNPQKFTNNYFWLILIFLLSDHNLLIFREFTYLDIISNLISLHLLIVSLLKTPTCIILLTGL